MIIQSFSLEGSNYISESGRDGEEESDCVDMGMKLMITMQTILSMMSQSRIQGRMMIKLKNGDHFILQFFHNIIYLGTLSRRHVLQSKHITSSTFHFNFKTFNL